MAYSVAEAARAIHAHLCTHNWHGYTQGSTRWGTGRSGYCEVKSQGYTFKVPAGDYDCSSSTITAWQLALEPTKYKGALKGATYTGNMRSVFTKSGLFEWKPISYIAKPGDLYLSEAHHVAMCQVQDKTKDTISEFVINEKGGITGGKVGDQTGSESVIRNYRVYRFGWDGILHYTGKADIKDAAPAPAPAPAKKTVAEIAKEVLDGKWGNGDTRKKKLEAAGYDYAKVQAEVNKLAAAPAKSITTIAKEVIAGKWGNGATRTSKLKAAGYDPAKVQAEVNRLLKK